MALLLKACPAIAQPIPSPDAPQVQRVSYPLGFGAEWDDALQTRDVQRVTALLRQARGQIPQYRQGATPLHRLSLLSQVDDAPPVIDALLAQGANVQATTSYGDSPLHEAAASPCTACVSAFLRACHRAGQQSQWEHTIACFAGPPPRRPAGRGRPTSPRATSSAGCPCTRRRCRARTCLVRVLASMSSMRRASRPCTGRPSLADTRPSNGCWRRAPAHSFAARRCTGTPTDYWQTQQVAFVGLIGDLARDPWRAPGLSAKARVLFGPPRPASAE